MHFEVLHPGLLGRSDVIALDTIHRPGLWGPCFTHHRPHNNHPRYAADTTTAGVLRFLATQELAPYSNAVLTTNHFDADAFLPVWAWLNPRLALEHARRLERIARCGDFFLELDEPSLKLAFALEEVHAGIRGRGERGERHVENEITRRCFEELLPVFGGWLEEPDRTQPLWQEPLAAHRADLRYLRHRVTEMWDLHVSLVELDRPVSAYALNSACRNDLLLSWRTDTGDRTLQVRPAIGWYELTSMPHQPGYDLAPLALELGWSLDASAARISTSASPLTRDQVLRHVEGWLGRLPLHAAYRRDVAEVFKTLDWPAACFSDQRFLGAKRLEFRPDSVYGGLFPTPGGGFLVSDDFHWNSTSHASLIASVEFEGETTPTLLYDGWLDPRQPARLLECSSAGSLRAARFLLEAPRLAASQEHGADFRLTSNAPFRIERMTLEK